MQTLSAPTTAADLVSSYRTFGEYGPVYQVLHAVNGGKVHILVVQTGEEIDYPVDQAALDPVAS